MHRNRSSDPLQKECLFKVVSLDGWRDFVVTITRSDESPPTRVLRDPWAKKEFTVRTEGVLQRVKDEHGIWKTPEGQSQYTAEQKKYHSKPQSTSYAFPAKHCFSEPFYNNWTLDKS